MIGVQGQPCPVQEAGGQVKHVRAVAFQVESQGQQRRCGGVVKDVIRDRLYKFGSGISTAVW